MEILVITWNYPPRRGGMEQLLASVCGGLSKNHRVWVVTAFAAKSIAGAGDNVFRPTSPGLARYLTFAISKGAALLRHNHKIRVVVGGSVLMTPIVVLLTRLFSRKAAVQAHGLDLIHRNPIYQFFIVRWLRRADRVFANSHHTAQLARQKGVVGPAITVIFPGVDWEQFQIGDTPDALKRTRGLENRRIILFVGRLARRKGVKEFIEHSLVEIVKRVPDVCFVIAGDNPTESLTHHDDVAGEIRETISRQDLSDYVRFLGAVSDSDLVQLYGLCDVLVLPVLELDSDVEGFGMVALEAAAAGKPVVATRVGGIPDAIEDGKTGILVAPGNYQSLSEAMVLMLKNRGMAFSMGETGRQRVIKEFSWSSVVSRYESEFKYLNDDAV